MGKPEPLIAVADLHGHATLFRRLLEEFDAIYGDAYHLVTLGDYVDNGPEIPELLDLLIELRVRRPERFTAILGNHDLACLRSIGWNGGEPDLDWWRSWSGHFWNAGLGTPEAYGARDPQELAAKMPRSHRAFLQSLDWYHDTGEYFFVHAGLKPGHPDPQAQELARKELLPNCWMQPQLRDKTLSTLSDPSWGRVVVSGHTKKPGRREDSHHRSPHFMTPDRITLSSEVDESGVLYAIEVRERRFFRTPAT